jgi:hypothetical protein
MVEEHHAEHAKKAEGHKARMKLPKLTKTDIISIIILIIFILLLSYPTYVSKDNCEVSRPAYKCATFKDVMIENCNYWGNYSCNTKADVSLTQIEWYIDNLCNLQNQYHSSGLGCSNLKKACNQITGKQTCPVSA